VTVTILVLVAFLVVRGGRALGPDLFFADTPWLEALLGQRAVFGGIWPSVVGTLVLVLGASALAIPLGILAGIHLAEAPHSRTTAALRWSVDLLAGIPSILMGWFGFGLILWLRATLWPQANTSLLLAMFCLALLVLPYLIRTTEAALLGLPDSLRLAGPALGLTPEQSLRRILLPAARRGLLGGVFLAVGRIAEDTAVILMTGVVANSGLPGGLTGKFQALPFDIYFLAAENRGPEDLQRAFGTAVVLLMLTGCLFIVAHAVHRELEQREGRET
jgi:phosphate transport system permease protein